MGRASGRSKAAKADDSQCTNCGTPFTLFNWKHQCRRCLRPFCNSCSKDRVVLTDSPHGKEPQRVCHACKVAERRFRLEGQGKRGPKRSGASPLDGAAGQAVDLGLGSDPLGGDTLGQPLTQQDLKDPDVSAALENLWLGGGGAEDSTSKKNVKGPKSKAPPAVSRPDSVSGGGKSSPQEEVQAMRRRAVALKKAGKDKEAMQALRHAHELEGGGKGQGPTPARQRGSLFDLSEEDMSDPDLLAQLHELGWTEDDRASKASRKRAGPATAEEATCEEGAAGARGGAEQPSIADQRAELEGAILAHKKRGLQLRKAGQMDAWREEMSLVQTLQAELEQQQQPGAPPAARPAAAAPPSSSAPGQAAARGPAGKGQRGGSSSEEADPEMRAALQQLGFSLTRPEAGADGKEALEAEIALRKRAAMELKWSGNLEGARAVLGEVRQLERRLQEEEAGAPQQAGPASRPGPAGQDRGQAAPRGAPAPRRDRVAHAGEGTPEDEQDEIAAALRAMGWQEESAPVSSPEASVRQSAAQLVSVVEEIAARTAALQQQVVAHKKAALAKKRAGDVEGAKQELRQSKALEAQLAAAEEAQAAGVHPLDSVLAAGDGGEETHPALHPTDLAAMRAQAAGGDEGPAVQVDSDDEQDPDILAQLRELGWREDGPAKEGAEGRPADVGAAGEGAVQARVVALKKQALAMRKQGDLQGAKAALASARQLEEQTGRGPEQEPTARSQARQVAGSRMDLAQVTALLESREHEVEVTDADERDPDILAALHDMGWRKEAKPPSPPPPVAPPAKQSIEALQAEARRLKREALGLRRGGKMSEWRAVVQQAQALEAEAEQAQAAASSAAAQAAVSGEAPAGLPDARDENDMEVTSEDESDPALLAALQAMGWQEEGQAAAMRTASKHTPRGWNTEPQQQEQGSTGLPARLSVPALPNSDSLSLPQGDLTRDASAKVGRGQGLEQDKEAAGTEVVSSPSMSVGGDHSDTAGIGAHPLANVASHARLPTYKPDRPPGLADPPTPLPAASFMAQLRSDAVVRTCEGAPFSSAVNGDRVNALQDRIKAGKQEAVRLKQQGRMDEARAALMGAKRLERELEMTRGGAAVQMRPGGLTTSSGGNSGAARKVVPSAANELDSGVDGRVEDAFDPDMMAALKGLGWTEEEIRGGTSKNQSKTASEPGRTSVAAPTLVEQRSQSTRGASQGTRIRGDGLEERPELEEQLKQKKRRVIELKRGGRQEEALALFKEVKLLEKQLA